MSFNHNKTTSAYGFVALQVCERAQLEVNQSIANNAAIVIDAARVPRGLLLCQTDPKAHPIDEGSAAVAAHSHTRDSSFIHSQEWVTKICENASSFRESRAIGNYSHQVQLSVRLR